MEFVYKVVLLSMLALAAQCEILTYGNGDVHSDFDVRCEDTYIRVYFNKTKIEERTNADGSNNRPYDISWKGQKGVAGCYVNMNNNTHFDNGTEKTAGNTRFEDAIWIDADFPGECGLSEMQTQDYIYYNQTIVITYGENPTAAIRREEYDYYMVSCLRNRTVEEKIDTEYFNVTYRTEGEDTKNNTVDYSFSLSHSTMGGIPSQEYNLGDYIKFDLQFNTAGSTVRAVIQECWSTSDGYNSAYKLIDSRCPVDVGTSLITAVRTQTSWKTEAFRYLGKSDSAVYVECLVRVCLHNDPIPLQECQWCSSRKRRDVGSNAQQKSTGEMAVVKSPVFFIVEKEQTTESSSASSSNALSGTNGTIVIVLLATLVFVIAVAVIKKVFFPTLVAVPNVSMSGIDNKGLA